MNHLLILCCLFIAIGATVRGQEAPPPDPGPLVAPGPSRDQLELLFYRVVFRATAPEPIPAGWNALTLLDAARTRVSRQLALRIDDLGRQASLTETQKKKLYTAGERDIREFFDRVEETKDALIANNKPRKRSELNAVRSRLGVDFSSGLFGEGSFFSKVADSTLSAEQAGKLQESYDKRRRERWRTRALIMAQAWGDAVGMDADQRRRFSDLIVTEVPPPTRFGQFDYYFIVYKLDRLPREMIRPIFDDAQWKVFNLQFDQMKAGRGFEDTLIRFGYDLGETDQAKPKPKAEQAK